MFRVRNGRFRTTIPLLRSYCECARDLDRVNEALELSKLAYLQARFVKDEAESRYLQAKAASHNARNAYFGLLEDNDEVRQQADAKVDVHHNAFESADFNLSFEQAALTHAEQALVQAEQHLGTFTNPFNDFVLSVARDRGVVGEGPNQFLEDGLFLVALDDADSAREYLEMVMEDMLVEELMRTIALGELNSAQVYRDGLPHIHLAQEEEAFAVDQQAEANKNQALEEYELAKLAYDQAASNLNEAEEERSRAASMINLARANLRIGS